MPTWALVILGLCCAWILIGGVLGLGDRRPSSTGPQLQTPLSPSPALAPSRRPAASSSLPATAEKRPTIIYYRTRDGHADYGFSLERQSDETYRIYIVSQPSYRDQSTDCHSTHRLSSGGRHYVCWRGELPSEKAARQVASRWADFTQEYIRTGRRF